MNIYVIIGRGFTKQEVIKEIRAEGYTHNFFFGDGMTLKDKLKEMKHADEIWTFGDCKAYDDFIYAKDKGYDIWVMG